MGLHRGPTIVTDGLVLYLDAANPKSYPKSGTIWNDLSGNGNNGTLINGPTFNSENFGFIRCDGIDDFIEVIDNPSLDFGSDSFTVEYWFRKLSNTTSFNDIWGVNKWNTGNVGGTNEWVLGIGNGTTGFGNNISFAIESNTTRFSTGTSNILLQINQWYQLIGQRSGDTLRTYLNSQLIQSVHPVGLTSLTSVNNVGRNIRVNNSNVNALYTNADNSIIRIYRKPLTLAEILQNYNATKGRFNL
jgi:hypothetical protein